MKRLRLIGLSALFLLIPNLSTASDLTVRPFLIDQTVEAREYFEEDVKLTNNTNRRLNVYATVNEISVDAEGEIKEFVSPIMTDRTNTITSWIEITRGRIEIEPGETETIPLGFRIHPNAEPGEYHVFIGFVSASKRFEAERAALEGEADGVITKLTIEDKSTEYLRIAGFLIDRFVTTLDDRKVVIELENNGDVPTTPEGEIVFFDSTGRELDAIPFNSDKLSIQPGETAVISSDIPLGNTLGRFKANLNLQYGTKQKATLYDSKQFFMLPLHMILFMFLIAMLLAVFIFFLLHRAMSYREEYNEGTDLPFIVREGHEANPKDHDIDLSNKK